MTIQSDASGAAEAESINDQLFASFTAEEENSWLVGGNNTVNTTATYDPEGWDADAQWDWTWC